MKKIRYTAPQTQIEPVQSGPVRVRFLETGDNQGVLELWLDYEKAETPTRAYFADFVRVVKGRADITLIFGRIVSGTTTLRSQVEISFPEDSFVSQLWRSTRPMHDGLRKSVEPLAPINVNLSANVHTSRANNVFIAVVGEEAICDFYYIAPSDLQFVKLGRRHSVVLEPILRISLSQRLLLEFLDACAEVIKQIPNAESILKRGEDINK